MYIVFKRGRYVSTQMHLCSCIYTSIYFMWMYHFLARKMETEKWFERKVIFRIYLLKWKEWDCIFKTSQNVSNFVGGN